MLNRQLMLAIVIPYYKISFFEETLQTLVEQTNKDFNVYIGNDNSSENPDELIGEYSSKLNLTYRSFKSNLGKTALVKQWDRCINLIEDEKWIMILGDDDFLGKNVVASFYKYLDEFKANANVVRFASQMIVDTNRKESEVYTHPILEDSRDSFYRKYKGLTRSSLSEHIFNKNQYLKYGFSNYPLAWHSDDRAWLDFSEQKPIYTINDEKVYIRVSSESISGKRDNLDLKRKSASMFYHYLVNEKLKGFTKIQQIEIVKSYLERTIAIRQLTTKEWLFLWGFYIRNFKISNFIKFLKTFVKSIFKVGSRGI